MSLRYLNLILLSVLVVMCVGQTVFYFTTHLDDFNVEYRERRWYRDVEDALLQVVESSYRPGHTEVYFFTEAGFDPGYHKTFINLLADGINVRTIQVSKVKEQELAELPHDQDYIFVMPPDNRRIHRLVGRYFDLPAPQMTDNPNVQPHKRYALYFVPAPEGTFYPNSLIRDRSGRTRTELRVLFGLSLVAIGGVWWAAQSGSIQRFRNAFDANPFYLAQYILQLYAENRFAFLTMLLVCISAFLFRPGNEASAEWGVVMLLAAAIMGGIAWRRANRTQNIELIPTEMKPITGKARLSVYNLLIYVGGVGLLGILTLANVNAEWQMTTASQMALLVGGMLMMGGALWIDFDRLLSPIPRVVRRSNPIVNRGVLPYQFVLVGILLVALLPRVIDLDTSIRRHVDEMLSIDSIVQLWDEPNTPLLVPYAGVAAFTRVYALLQSISVEILGANLTGLRMVSAIFGTLTVGAVYLLARQWFDRPTALLAAFLLAVFPPHIHFSRIGINNVVDVFFGVMALALVSKGMRRQTKGIPPTGEMHTHYFVLAGVMLGLTQYFYEGGRLLFPPLVVMFALVSGRMTWRDWVALLGTAVIAAAPVYLTLALGNFSAAPRLQDNLDESYWSALLRSDVATIARTYFRDHLRDPLWFYVQKPDTSWFYGGSTALVLSWALPFFLLGFIHAGWRSIRQAHDTPAMRLILLWLLTAAVGNSLLVMNRESPRYVVMFPAAALTLAVGIRYTIGWFATPSASDRNKPRNEVVWLVVIGTTLAILQVGYYFGTHTTAFMKHSPEVAWIDDVRFRAGELADNTHIHLITNTIVFDTDSYSYLRFVGREADGVFITVTQPRFLQESEVLDPVPGRNHAFFVPPRDHSTIALLEQNPNLLGPLYSENTRPPSGKYVMYFTAGAIRSREADQ